MLLRKNQLYKQPYDSTCSAKVPLFMMIVPLYHALSHFILRFRIYEYNICSHISATNLHQWAYICL